MDTAHTALMIIFGVVLGIALFHKYNGYQMGTGVRICVGILGIAALGIGLSNMYQGDQRHSHITSQQESIRERVNALEKEKDETMRSVDPKVVKSWKERVKAVQKDLDVVKREVKEGK